MIQLHRYKDRRSPYWAQQKRYVTNKEMNRWIRSGIQFVVIEHPTFLLPQPVKVRAKRKRAPVVAEPIYDENPLTNRLCRKCNKQLPASRYFNHENCALSDYFIPYGEQEWGGFVGRY